MTKKRKYKPTEALKDFFALLIVICIASFGGFLIDTNKIKYAKPVPNVPPPLGEVRRVPLPSPHNVWHYLNKIGIKFPKIVYKQIIAETGLTSWCVKENNNLTCMRLPKKRITTAIGENKGYAVYSSWKSCLEDYLLFQTLFNGKTEDDYYAYLGSYGHKDYVDSLKQMKITYPK